MSVKMRSIGKARKYILPIELMVRMCFLCFESFLLILTYSCKPFKAQLSQKSRSYPVIVS